MNPELQNTLAMLAQKFGTSVEHLYPMLVAKAKLDAVLCVYGFGFLTILGVAVVTFLIYALAKWDWDEIVFVPILITVLLVVIFACLSVGNISNYRYPEAAAIHSLLNK
jgi:hypothetical protein